MAFLFIPCLACFPANLYPTLRFLLLCVSCVSKSASISDIFPQTPQPHHGYTHLLSSQLSIPNRLTGLWQKMPVDLLGASGSSGACLTCVVLERRLALPHLSRVSFVAQHMQAGWRCDWTAPVVLTMAHITSYSTPPKKGRDEIWQALRSCQMYIKT